MTLVPRTAIPLLFAQNVPAPSGVGTFCVSFSPNGAQLSGLGTEAAAETTGKTGPAAATQISDRLGAQEVFFHRTLIKCVFRACGKCA